MNRLPYIILVLVGIPAALLWALGTLRSRASLACGTAKLLIGIGLFFLLLLEWKLRPLNLLFAAMATATALLGVVDLVAAKVHLMKGKISEQSTGNDSE